MTLILNGTSGITDVNGTAAAPAITGTDTDTGVFFGTNTVSLSTNGTERVTLDASGNLGIGTTSPTWILSLRKDSASSTSGGYPVVQINNANASGYAGLYLNDSTALAGLETQRSTAHLAMYAGGAERARIDSSGNLLVGGTTARTRITLQTGEANAPTLGTASGGAFFGNSNVTYGTLFGTSGSGYGWIQQQRVDGTGTAYDLLLQPSGGNLLVGTTSNTSASKFAVNGRVGFYDAAGNQNAVTFIQNKGAGSANSGGFGLAYTTVNYTPGSASSNIYWDGGTGYFTLSTSSRKYKRNITPVTDEQLDKALLLKPSYYQRLEYDYWEYGLIAEEVHDVGLDEFVTRVEGEISGLNYEKMVTLAFGLIQRQQAIITQLQADVAALKGQA